MADVHESNPQDTTSDATDPVESAEGQPEDTQTDHITQDQLVAVVGEKATRKLEARREKNGSVWFGLGMFGMIGWSVAVPTLVCVALGIWLDSRWPSRFSWTLMLLMLGMGLGCLNAWYWVTRERAMIGQKATTERLKNNELKSSELKSQKEQ